MPRLKHNIALICCALASYTLIMPSLALGKSSVKKPTPVIVSTVAQANFADYIEALGTTYANERVVLSADRSEKITAIHFSDGATVQQGQLLISLDKTEEQAQFRAAQALTTLAQASYQRAKNLRGNRALPKATLQERLTELKQAQAAQDALQASLASYEIRAPFDGVLGFRQVSVGTLLQPGDTVTTIYDLSQIKVDFLVPSLHLQSLKPGLEITGQVDAFDQQQFTGTITTIASQIDPMTRTIKARAIIPNPGHSLKPGLLMNVRFAKNNRTALLIPEEALIKRASKNFVFTVEEKNEQLIAQQLEVSIGARIPGIVEILSGLDEGDTIVLHGALKLRDDAPVRLLDNKKNTPLQTFLDNVRGQKKLPTTKTLTTTTKEP